MRVLALDPGATRTGWSVLTNEPEELLGSGVVHVPRGAKEAFQEYRMRLTLEWVDRSIELFDIWQPDQLICETVPSRGAGIPEQLYLANVQITVVHALAAERNIPVHQVSARTVQAHIAIRGKGKKITKVQVRNGVFARFPQLQPRFKEFVKVFEESDAIAIALYFCDHLALDCN